MRVHAAKQAATPLSEEPDTADTDETVIEFPNSKQNTWIKP